MSNKERMVLRLLDGAKKSSTDVKIAALLAIGESGLIDDDRLVSALEDASKLSSTLLKATALTAIGRMLKNSNRQ